MNSVTITMWR